MLESYWTEVLNFSGVLKRRNNNTYGVQDTKWKRVKAKENGDSSKIIYSGRKSTVNTVSVIIDKNKSKGSRC